MTSQRRQTKLKLSGGPQPEPNQALRAHSLGDESVISINKIPSPLNTWFMCQTRIIFMGTEHCGASLNAKWRVLSGFRFWRLCWGQSQYVKRRECGVQINMLRWFGEIKWRVISINCGCRTKEVLRRIWKMKHRYVWSIFTWFKILNNIQVVKPSWILVNNKAQYLFYS